MARRAGQRPGGSAQVEGAPKPRMPPAPTPNWKVMGGEVLRMRAFLALHAPGVRLPRGLLTSSTREGATHEQVAGRALAEAWEAAMRSTRWVGLPIAFGAGARCADLGLYGFLVKSSATGAEGLERAVRFQRLVTTAARFHLEHGAGVVRWVQSNAGVRSLGARVVAELVLAEHVAIFRELVPAVRPVCVRLMHRAPADTSEHERFFGCPLAWSSDRDCVEWDAAATAVRREVDAELSAFLLHEAEQRLALLPPDELLAQVREVIVRRLPEGDADLEEVASALGRAPRTLRRELKRVDCSFRGLLDEVRRARAQELVAGRATMTEVALRLGFSEVSALSRAWRRWFKVSFRESLARVQP